MYNATYKYRMQFACMCVLYTISIGNFKVDDFGGIALLAKCITKEIETQTNIYTIIRINHIVHHTLGY
jgi:hypothetical protein